MGLFQTYARGGVGPGQGGIEREKSSFLPISNVCF
jgi:hypothetical protein